MGLLDTVRKHLCGVVVLVAAWTFPVHAQTFVRTIPTPVCWQGDDMVLSMADHQGRCLKIREIPSRIGVRHKRMASDLARPKEGFAHALRYIPLSDAMHLVETRYDHPRAGEKRLSIFRKGGQGWDPVAFLQRTEGKMAGSLVPLENGKALFFDLSRDAAPCALYRPNAKGELEMDSAVDLGMDAKKLGPLLRAGPFSSWPLVVTGSFVIAIHPPSGWWWAFSLKNGNLRKHGRLFEEIEARHLAIKAPALLIAAHPLPDGDVLLVSRDPKFLTESGPEIAKTLSIERELSSKLQDPGQALELAKRRAAERDMLHPFLHWFRFSEATVTFKRLKHAPLDAPEIITSTRDMERATQWLPSKDGERIFSWRQVVDAAEDVPEAKAIQAK